MYMVVLLKSPKKFLENSCHIGNNIMREKDYVAWKYNLSWREMLTRVKREAKHGERVSYTYEGEILR